MKVLLTGRTGFIGSALGQAMLAKHLDVLAPIRGCPNSIDNEKFDGYSSVIGAINATTDWRRFLTGVETVVHCAAISEVDKYPNTQQLEVLRSVNISGTLNLACQAASLGVRRFVFLSSIKVNGGSSRLGAPLKYNDIPLPEDAYGLSKLEAERGLKTIARDSGMEFVIIRPPLVYGRGVKGNFAMLMKLVEYGFPLPLSNVRNRRSFIGIDNLVDLVITCINHPEATNKTLLASDDQDLSTTELLRGISQALGKSTRLFPCPKPFLATAAKCVGKTALAEKLLESLQVDI